METQRGPGTEKPSLLGVAFSEKRIAVFLLNAVGVSPHCFQRTARCPMRTSPGLEQSAGTDHFTASPFGSRSQTVEVSVPFIYTTPGTYFPALRVPSQREGDTSTPFAKVQNLGRVRVVVHQSGGG